MNVLTLTAMDRRLLAARFAEHGNSHRRMAAALREAGAAAPLRRLRALRRLELEVEVDLGSLCWRFHRRDRPETHPLERAVLDYVAVAADAQAGDAPALWVLLDRLREVREWIEDGELAREREA